MIHITSTNPSAYLLGKLVRFKGQKETHWVCTVAKDGMIELHDLSGFFAPHLFELVGENE